MVLYSIILKKETLLCDILFFCDAYNITKQKIIGKIMRRMIGFIFFWIAVGMTIMLFLRHAFFSLLLIILFYFLSYYLFCKC